MTPEEQKKKLGLGDDVPMLDMGAEDFKEQLDFALWSDHSSGDYRMVGPPPKDKEERRKWQDVWMATPGPDRERLRSVTYQGVADAMASQWG